MKRYSRWVDIVTYVVLIVSFGAHLLYAWGEPFGWFDDPHEQHLGHGSIAFIFMALGVVYKKVMF